MTETQTDSVYRVEMWISLIAKLTVTYEKFQDENNSNEMVSTGDTEISLHIRSPKTPELLKFKFGGGGYSGVKYSKCQDLSKFQFSVCVWGEGGYSGVKYSKYQDLSKFQFSGGVLWSQIFKVPISA